MTDELFALPVGEGATSNILARARQPRVWRSVKYEEVYLRAYETVAEARRLIGVYLDFFSRKRPHLRLDARTPDQAYPTRLPSQAAA